MSNFSNISRQLKYNTYPIPRISKMPFILEYFQYAIFLDLNMRYYDIKSARTQVIYVPQFLHGKYR